MNSTVLRFATGVTLAMLVSAVLPAAEHPLGVAGVKAETTAPTAIVPRAALPASLDLSGQLPPIGDQGMFGSCVGWATAYYLKTHEEQVERQWGDGTPDHQFSPLWVYNQINHGVDAGSYVEDALNLLQQTGCDTLADFNPGTYTVLPSPASIAAAAPYKIIGWNTVAHDVTSVKAILAEGRLVPIVIAIASDFDTLSGANPIYDSFDPVTYRGLHAVCIVGWDDAKQAFKLVNQWGTGWGLGGYGWISYAFIGDATVVQKLFDAHDMTAGPSLAIAAVADATKHPRGTGRFRIDRSGPTAQALSVSLSFTGTAQYGVEYNAPAAVAFNAGDTVRYVDVVPADQSTLGDRTIVAAIVPNAGAFAVTAGSAAISIRDLRPILSVTSATGGSEPATNGSFTLHRTGGATAVAARIAMSGTATNGVDYAAITGPLAIPAGAVDVVVPMTVINDRLLEGDETVVLTLLPDAKADADYRVATPAAQTAVIHDNLWYRNEIWHGQGIAGYGRVWVDLNGDGKADYVTNDQYGNFFVSLSTGTGYTNAVWSGHGVSENGPHFVDMNGDGKIDYVTSDRYGRHYVSLSTGTGFVSQIWSGHGIWRSGRSWWIDLNGDHKADYASVADNGTHFINLSTGTGYEFATWAGNGVTTTGFNWADLNGDGKMDYVTSNGQGQHFVSLSTGSGYINQIWQGNGIGSSGLYAWADLNGDGKADYVTTDSSGRQYVSLSTGTGYVNSIWSSWGLQGGSGQTWVDLNGDGKADFVYVKGTTHYVSLSTGSGFTNITWSGHGVSTTGTHWADLNGDGLLDYVTSDGAGNHYVSIANGYGAFDVARAP